MRSSGLPAIFSREPLVVLRADVDFLRGRHRDAHRPHASAARRAWLRVLARLRPHAPVPHGDAALGKILDAERIAERLRQLLEFEHFFRVGLFVDAMQRSDAALLEILARRLRSPRA